MSDNDKRIDHCQRIADRLQSLNMALDAAYADGHDITLFVLPSYAHEQDNPIVGVRLAFVQGDTEHVSWIGMDVPHADEES